MPRPKKYLWLGRSMLWGGIYDLLFGLPILLIPRQMGAILQIKCPENPIYVRYCGLFLLILAVGYLIAWRDINKNLGIARMMVVSRSLGFIFMLEFSIWGGMGLTFLFLAVGDLVFGLTHMIFLLRKS
jgi:hypothetical protein